MRYIPKLQFGDQLNLLRKVSKSNADFINRLKQPNRDVIKDWASPNIATHKMSWATDDQGAIIYPQVQNINGKLTDFSRPPYNKWAGLGSAIEKGDTLKTTPELAQWFTTNYKKFFPKFHEGGKLIPKLQTAWSPLTLTPEKEQAAQKLIQQRALQGYNTLGVNWLKETPEITSKRKALVSKQQTEYQNKRFANRTNEVPVLGMPAATQIGLKNVHPEFALMTGGVGSGMSGIKGAMGYGAIQGGLWNSAGIAGEQNLGGLVGNVIGGGIAGGVIKGASPYVKKGVDYITSPIKRLTDVPRRNLAISEYITPFGYEGKTKDIKDFLKGYVLKGRDVPEKSWLDIRSQYDPLRAELRAEAWRKYLQVPKKTDNLYLKNSDGTFRYNPERIPKENIEFQRRAFKDVGSGNPSKEYLTEQLQSAEKGYVGNAGGVTSIIDDVGNFTIKDTWDLMPLQRFKWLPKKIQNVEVGKLVGAKPFTVLDDQIGKIPKQPQIDLNFESTNHHTTPFLDDIQVKEAYGKIAKSATKFMKLQKSPEFQKRYKEFAYGWHTGSDINIINPEVIPYQVFNNTSLSTNPHQHMFKNALGFFDNNQNKAFVKINTNSDLEQTTGHELLHKFTKANYRNKYDNNPNWENKWWFDEFASKKYPGNLPEEHLANMIGYRVSKNIPPERNFTAEESIDFINNHMRLYNNTIKQRYPNYKENLTSAVEFIKAFGAVAAPVTIADKFKK